MLLPKLIKEEVSSWLLDHSNPGASYLALNTLADIKKDNPELLNAREKAHQIGPIHTILESMQPEGFWEKEGAGYLPKYRSTVWSLILLAQLGAKADNDPRIKTACDYYLDHSFTSNGQISSSGTPGGKRIV